MRRLLDGLYLAAGLLAALSIVAIAVLIVVQVGGRFAGRLVPGADDLVAWCTAGSIFLGLPYAMAQGAHIRVELVVSNLPARWRERLELAVLAGATALVGYVAWYCTAMVVESWRYGELAMGQLPIPLWIPQLSLAFGVNVLLVALLDCLLLMLRGHVPLYRRVPAGGAGGSGFD